MGDRRLLLGMLALGGFIYPSCALGESSPASLLGDYEKLLSPSFTFKIHAHANVHGAAAARDEQEPRQAEGEAEGEAQNEATEALPRWRALAATVAGLQQMDCADDTTGATMSMLNAAEAEEDPLAMAALGTMFLLGQECAPKRNLTWGLHWLSRAAAVGQADAMATLGFLHDSDALKLLYNFTEVTFSRKKALPLYEAAAAKGSLYASMVLGYKHANGVDGLVPSCPASATYYEQAAIQAIEGAEELRFHTVEQSTPMETEHLTLLTPSTRERERVDAAQVEYMDYCAHVGDGAGKLGVAHMYHAGSHGAPRDLAAAEYWFKSAADGGEPGGHAQLGIMHLRKRRYSSAIRSLRRAAKLNEPSGWAGLGYAYLYGAGLPQSDTLAARALALAARMGHLDAIYNLGVLAMQRRGDDFKQAEAVTAFRYWSVAAEYSMPQAQVLVGRMALRGLGVRKDCRTASFYLKHAVDSGPLPRSLLGIALAAHEGRRPQRATMHYLLAGHAGLSVGLHNAGYLLAEEMPGVRRPDAKAFKRAALSYLQEAALAGSTGSAEAQVQLANLISEAPKNHQLAVELYREAAQAGSSDALWHLGYAYWKGRGVKADRARAMQLFRQSGMGSKFARLKGPEALLFRAMRFFYNARVAICLIALVATVMATGDPLAALSRTLSPNQPTGEWVDDGADDDFDAFDDDE